MALHGFSVQESYIQTTLARVFLIEEMHEQIVATSFLAGGRGPLKSSSITAPTRLQRASSFHYSRSKRQ